MKDLQQQIDEIKARNKRVEIDKARETSRARKILIALLTYAVIVLFFYAASLPKPFLNALVPTIAFILSTLGFDLFKKLRIRDRK
jgi:4-hydroxybenzoate polyprenyltransferase